MTSSDEPSEGFLRRWSRTKIAAEQNEKCDPAEPHEAAAPERTEGAAPGDIAKPATAKPEFDLSSLPSLETITAGSDIRAFLNPGVPAELTRAALRRAWTVDATIRSFVGLAENAWDFNDPAAMPGFGPLEAGYDVQRAVAQMFGEVGKLAHNSTAMEKPAAAESADPAERFPVSEAAGEIQPAAGGVASDPPAIRHEELKIPEGDFVQRDNNTAAHKSNREVVIMERKARRNHGGALPQ